MAVAPLLAERAQAGQDALGFFLAEGAFAAVAASEGTAAVDRLHFLDQLREVATLDGSDDGGREIRAGQLVGARQMVVGSYATVDGIVRVNLRLVEVESRRVLTGFRAHAPSGDPMGLRDEVYCAVRRALANTADATCQIASSAMTRSEAAQLAFAESLLALYRGRQVEARERLRRALEADPNFVAARRVRDALYFSAALGNQWTYRFTSTEMEGEMVRTVVSIDRHGAGGDVATTTYRIPVVVTGPWGTCSATVGERLLLDYDLGWALLLQESVEYVCTRLSRPWSTETRYEPGLPYVPLRSDASPAQVASRRIRITSTLPGVATSAMDATCTTQMAPSEAAETPMGRLDGVALTVGCHRAGARDLRVFNAERAGAFQAGVRAQNAEVERISAEKKDGWLTALLYRGVKEVVAEKVPEPEDFEASAYGIFDTEALSSNRVFVPGVGITSFTKHNSRGGSARREAGAVARLTGMTVHRLSPLSVTSGGAAESTPVRVLGDTAVSEASALGGRPTSFEFGLLLLFRPEYERIRLSLPGERVDVAKVGHGLGLSMSHWVGGVLRIRGAGEAFAGVNRRDMTRDAETSLYGKEYNHGQTLGLEASLRGRLSPLGWMSVPQLEVGSRVQVFEVANDSGAAGTYGKLFKERRLLWRHFVGLVAQVNFHDRLIIEGAYRYSRWSGTFGLADVDKRVSFDAHGPRAMLCLGSNATAGSTGFGVCLHGFAEFAVSSSAPGAPSGAPASVGGLLELVLRRGMMPVRPEF